MQSLLHNNDTQSKYDWSVVNTCNNNNRNNINITQQPFVSTINHCHDNNSNINQNNMIMNNATTSQVEPARFASNMSYNNQASINNALMSQTAASNIRNTNNNMNNDNIFDVMKRNNFIGDNTNQEQTEMLRSSRANDSNNNNNNNYYIMHQEGNNNNMNNNEHNNINDHFTLHSNHVMDLQSRNSQTCQKQNTNENTYTSTAAAVRESNVSNTSNNKINNNKCNEISVAESNTTVLPSFNGDATLLSTEENNHQHDVKLTPHQNEDDNNIMKVTPHSNIPTPVHCKTNHLQTSPSESEKINGVTSSATENTTPANTIVIPLKNISFANTPSKAPNTQSLSSLSSSVLCNVQNTASPRTTTTTTTAVAVTATDNKENCNNSNSNNNKVDNHNANYNVANQANPQLLQNTQLMYVLPSSLLRSTNINQQVNHNVKINNTCTTNSSNINNNNNMNTCYYAANSNNVNNQNVFQANVNATTIQNMPIRELSHANTNITSAPSPTTAAAAAQTLSQNNIIPQNVLAQLSPAQLCALAHSLNASNKHQPQQPQGQSLSFAAQPVVLVNPSLLTSHTSLQSQMPCQLMSRSCVLPAAQMGINANILHSNTAVGMNNTNQNITSNSNNSVSSTNNNSVASQNELLMKMLLERQRQVTASVNTQVLQQEILPTHHRCNGTGYVLHCLYEGTVKRYNPVRGFGFLTATVQLIEIDKAKVQELLMVLKQPPLVQSTPEALLNDSTNQMSRMQEVQNDSLSYGSKLNKVSNECTRNNCSGNVNKDNTSVVQPVSEEPYRYYLRHPVCLGDIFVHQSYLQMHGFRSLPIGGRVRFRAEQFNGQNALHATDVELLPQIIPSEVMRKLQQGEKEAELLQCINRINAVNQQVCNIATINNTSAVSINDDRCRTMNVIDNSSNNDNMSITTAAALQNNLNSANSTNVTAFQDTSMPHRNKCISTINTSHINGVGGDESVSTLGLSYTVKEISQSNDLTLNNNYNNNNCKAESTMISNQCNNAANCANDLCWLDSANYTSVLCDDFIDNDSDNESINSFNCDIDFNDCEWTSHEEKL